MRFDPQGREGRHVAGCSSVRINLVELNRVAAQPQAMGIVRLPRTPIGRGYDDALVSAREILRVLQDVGQRLAQLRKSLQTTWQSPTIGAYCAEDVKYGVVERIRKQYTQARDQHLPVAGQPIVDLIEVNGIRTVLADGTWGLVRVSSNKPSLVVVTEAPVSEKMMRAMFEDIDSRLTATGDVGPYDQTF